MRNRILLKRNNTSKPKRFVPLQFKITLFSALLVFVSLSIVGSLSYRRIISSNIEPLVGKRLDYSARGVAVTIPGEKYTKIIAAFLKNSKEVENLSEFLEVHQSLVIAQRQNELATDIQTWIKDPTSPDRMISLVSSGDGSNNFVRQPLNPWVAKVFKEGLPSFTPIYSKGGKIWISGFAPIETEKGETTGVIQVDYEASEEVELVKQDVLKTLATAGLFGFALSLILGVFLGRTLSRPVQKLSAAAKEVMNGNLSPVIEVTTNDEIGTLTTIFRNMISEIRTSRQSLEDYSKNLESKVRDRTAELKESNQKIAAMLDSLGQGFFLFQSDGICLSIHSKACLQLLEGSPTGKSLSNYFRTDLSGGINDWVSELFSEVLPFESIAPLGLNRYPHSAGLIVDLDYHAIRDDEGKVKWVMVVATDKTTEFQAQKTAELEQARSRRILLIIENKDQFLTFVREMMNIFEGINTQLVQNSPQALLELTRGLHTIKGGAALFQLRELTDLVHQKETETLSLQEKVILTAKDWVALNSIMDSVRDELEKALLEFRPILGDLTRSDIKTYHLSESILLTLLEQAKKEGLKGSIIESWEKQLLHEPLLQSFKYFNAVVTQAAESLGKQIHPIRFEGEELNVYLKNYQGLFSSLVHAFRNAVDHGIESPQKRREVGKSEIGEIRVTFKTLEQGSTPPLLHIQMSDDGGGIDANLIKMRLNERNPSHPLLNANDFDVYQALFEPGFSTKAEVTDLSGRGVGLDAILHETLRLKGRTWIESQLGRGTTLTIEVPLFSAMNFTENNEQ